jgi:two-component system NtrC family sensor kinase
MSIAFRLWLSLVATFVLVLGLGVAIRVEEEQRLLLETTLRDRRFFAHALQAALSREHGTDPVAEAETMLGREEVAEAHIVARLVATRRPELPRPNLPNVAADLERGDVAVGVHDDEILTYIPLDRGAEVIAVELAEPHAVPDILRRISLVALALQVIALATAASIVAFVLVRQQVGRPLARLATLARRIARGDLAARERIEATHEVADLAREMNTMAQELESTRRALDESEVERTQALEQLRHADRLRTVGELASQLAHELGTPLNVVSGHARLIEQDPSASAEVKSSARTALEQTAKMTKSIRGVLDFSRRKSERRVVDLVELAESAQATLSPLARRARAQVVVERQGTVGRVEANSQEILQVLTNLLVNAFQAMREGGLVRVAVSERDAEPPPGTNATPGRFVVISVIDRGSGIAEEDMPHLFDAFFTRKAEGEGTGLGLAVVDGIVREHRGWVAVQSSVGKGTTFEVFLPAASAPVSRSHA